MITIVDANTGEVFEVEYPTNVWQDAHLHPKSPPTHPQENDTVESILDRTGWPE